MVAKLGNYEIFSDGRIFSNITSKYLVLKPNSNGYNQVTICNGKRKNYSVHRLIAKAFIPNPENKSQVNHINGIKTDNRVENLEWCTPSENEKHSYRFLGKKNGTPSKGKFGKDNHSSIKIKQMDKNNNLIKVWNCARDVHRELGVCLSSISNCCKNKRNSAGGFMWGYA